MPRRGDATPGLVALWPGDRRYCRLAAVTGLKWALMRSAAIVGVLSDGAAKVTELKWALLRSAPLYKVAA